MNELTEASIKLILANQSHSGGYIASPNFRVYRYSWYRDGAFIAHAMLLSDQIESARKFHNWAAENINIRSNQIQQLLDKKKKGIHISPEEHLHCRYTIDNKESEEEWTSYQLDGFGTWIWSLDEFYKFTHELDNKSLEATSLLIPYLSEFWQDGQFDWWEESFGHQHISTIGSIAVGLKRCADWQALSPELRTLARNTSKEIEHYIYSKGVKDGHLIKWIGSEEVDGSLAALISPLGLIDPSSELAIKTVSEIKNQLGLLGTRRHVNDVYFGGGRWLILSCFLALSLIKIGDFESAKEVITWLESQADSDLELPEQVGDDLLFPEAKKEWVAKWGEPAKPLLWSHAMYLMLNSELNKVLN